MIAGRRGEIEVNRTDHRGTYAGAFFAYLDLPMARSYAGTLRAVTDCRFWELPAEDFGRAVREWFPMATHMLEGFAIQGMGSQQTVSTRERLVALGTVTAGLTHELNNPATAAARATATLSERLAGLWEELAGLAGAGWTPTGWPRWPAWSARPATAAPPGAAVAAGGLRPRGRAGRLAGGARGRRLGPGPAAGRRRRRHRLAGAGRRHRPRRGAAPRRRVAAMTCEAESLLEEVAEAAGRISALIGAAKQYSQMDRSPSSRSTSTTGWSPP